ASHCLDPCVHLSAGTAATGVDRSGRIRDSAANGATQFLRGADGGKANYEAKEAGNPCKHHHPPSVPTRHIAAIGREYIKGGCRVKGGSRRWRDGFVSSSIP